MPRGQALGIRYLLAWVAVCGLMAVGTISLLPNHGHPSGAARTCDICHSGHLPCLQVSAELRLNPQAAVCWHLSLEDWDSHSPAASRIHSARAPPV